MKRAFPALLALLCATLALLIATTSSPLYAAIFGRIRTSISPSGAA